MLTARPAQRTMWRATQSATWGRPRLTFSGSGTGKFEDSGRKCRGDVVKPVAGQVSNPAVKPVLSSGSRLALSMAGA